jgi:multiple sugar transport system permease protein
MTVTAPVATLSPDAQRALRQGRRRRILVENLQGWLFALPWLLGLLLFFVVPMVWSIGLSLTTYNVADSPRFIGLGNYAELIADPLIWHSLRVTTVYALISVPLTLILGLGLALLLNQQVRGLAVWRTIYYLPAVISGVAVALLWEWLFNGRFGLINYLLELVGINGPNWLADPNTALVAFVMVQVWAVGGTMLINLAALQGVPTQLYEAASIDGANAWHRFRHITVPSISPVIFYNLIIGLIAALQSFTLFFIMTQGGPNNATLTFMLYLYKMAFQNLRMGYASAMAWLLFLYLALLTALIFKSSSRWVFYEASRREERRERA